MSNQELIEFLTDRNKLTKFFESLDVANSMKIKSVLVGDGVEDQGAVSHLKSLSPELIQMLEKEGLSVEMLVPTGSTKPRRKRTLVLERQSFARTEEGLKLAIGRAKSAFAEKKIEVVDYKDITDKEEQSLAKQLVQEYNNN